MLARRLLRKFCLIAAFVPLAAHAGEVKISIRVPWVVPALLAAFFPPPPPLPPSRHHLGIHHSRLKAIDEKAQAVDARTFVAGGTHYRLAGVAAESPGSPQEAAARRALQARLDAHPVRVRITDIEPSGIRIVELEPGG